jgi:hypothetical protein
MLCGRSAVNYRCASDLMRQYARNDTVCIELHSSVRKLVTVKVAVGRLYECIPQPVATNPCSATNRL